MCCIKVLFQLSVFLLCVNVCFQQTTLSSSQKRLVLKDLMAAQGEVTDDPYDAEDKTNPNDLDEILNIDTGRYTTMLFHYHNHQNTYPTANYVRETNDTCIDSYLACLISSTTRTFVCVTNDLALSDHTFTFMSHCDMYFDNCRRGYRIWRVIAQGYCFWNIKGEKKIYEFPSDVFISDYDLKIIQQG